MLTDTEAYGAGECAICVLESDAEADVAASARGKYGEGRTAEVKNRGSGEAL